MEKNCLVTTYKANTGDDSLLRIGEMRIKISSIGSPNEYSQSIILGFDKSVDLEIIGGGYFTDATLRANNGKKLTCNAGNNVIHFSNGNYEIAILDKYSLSYLMASKQDGKYYPNKVIDLKYLKYSYKLTHIVAGPDNLSGDISALSGLTKLNTLVISNNNLSGDISALSDLTSLVNLDAYNSNLSGDISALSGLTKLNTLNVMENPNISGDISLLSSLTLLKSPHFGIDTGSTRGTKLICSDISTLKSMTGMTDLYIKGVNTQGDLSLLPASLRFLTNSQGSSNCSWNNSRPSSSNIFAIEGNLPVDNIDGMLNDFSNCVVPNKPSSAIFSVISVSGTRTSASDAAVSNLKSKGYTIKVNGVAI